MSCNSTGIQECDSIQIIEPDSTLPAVVGGALGDPAINELGEVALAVGQVIVPVKFQARKLSAQYRFEYLYVDDFSGSGGDNNPGTIIPVPTVQTVDGFTVELTGTPPFYGYVLRWRVVVISAVQVSVPDAPESLYLQLPNGLEDKPPDQQSQLDIFFVNPRTSTNYGFTELRVENLVDPHTIQAPISVQVFEKRTDGFKIAINPIAPNGNYWLTVRTP